MLYLGLSLWRYARRRLFSVMAGDDDAPLIADDGSYLETYE